MKSEIALEGYDSFSDSSMLPQQLKEFEPRFEWCRKLFAASQLVCDELGKLKWPEMNFVHAFGSLYMNCIGSFLSIVHLCRIGHSFDALRIGRSLTENLIFMHYLLTDSEQLSKRFKSYAVFARIKYLEGAKDVSFMAKDRDQLDRQIKRLRNEYASELKTLGKCPFNWTGMSIAALVENEEIWPDTAPLRDIYNTDFRNFSNYVHANWLTLSRMFDEEDARFRQYYDIEDIGECLLLTGDVFLRVCELVAQTFDLPLLDEIRRVGDKMPTSG